MASKFTIYLNGTPLMFKIGGTKKDAQGYIKTFLVSTHMGQWRKLANGWAYDTTIGKYYEFRRDNRWEASNA
jgi:hypothetical protein